MASQPRRTSTRARERNGDLNRARTKSSPKLPAPLPAGNGARDRAPQAPHDKRAEIFAAALHLFQAKGYHGASMQDLADAVGMQKASLYYYFHSKEDLLVLVCERGTNALTTELVELTASDLSATEKLKHAIEYHLIALCEQLDLFTVFLREQKFLNATQKQRLRGAGKKHAELLGAILEQGIASGEFRSLNVRVTTLAILGMCNWLSEWYSPDGPLTPREIAAILSDLVWRGLVQQHDEIA
jgi:AcrR family transcriptional regulator